MSRPVFLLDAPAAAAAVADARRGDRLTLDDDEGRHAADVMRLRVGEPIGVTDGAGTMLHGVVVDAARRRVVVRVDERFEVPRPGPRITVVQAIAKGDRGESAVEMLTEVGVDRIVPWAARRSVAVWRGDRGAKALARWRRTARAATKQARRAWLPRVEAAMTTAEVAELLQGTDLGLVLHEGAHRPLAGIDPSDVDEIVLVVGPEGGIDEDELAAFGADRAVRMGPTVLRTSTAGVAAVAALLSRTARWGVSAP